jgi:hypothetical protein
MLGSTCEWTLEMDDWNAWAAECRPGRLFTFETPDDEGPCAHGFEHCPYCGKELVEVRAVPVGEESED